MKTSMYLLHRLLWLRSNWPVDQGVMVKIGFNELFGESGPRLLLEGAKLWPKWSGVSELSREVGEGGWVYHQNWMWALTEPNIKFVKEDADYDKVKLKWQQMDLLEFLILFLKEINERSGMMMLAEEELGVVPVPVRVRGETLTVLPCGWHTTSCYLDRWLRKDADEKRVNPVWTSFSTMVKGKLTYVTPSELLLACARYPEVVLEDGDKLNEILMYAVGFCEGRAATETAYKNLLKGA